MTLRTQGGSQEEDATVGRVIVLHFTGFKVSLDEEKMDRLYDEIFALAEEQGESDLFLNFRNVDYLNSKVLGTLVRLHKKLLARGRRMAIGNLRPAVYEVFSSAALHTLLNLRLSERAVIPSADKCQARLPPGVLVVDDETEVLCALASKLCAAGYPVWLASHGQLAVERYRRHRDEIAMVLLDVQMPGIDGPHTLITLQHICPTVRCCFMLENPRIYTEKYLLLLGATRVFRKPFAFIEVLRTLKQLTGQPSRRRQDRWIEIP